ncbi:hypothetical protein Ddye_031342 [Dipteronia dyeriana]|uniref:Uncharacterized protein n=1 Tax=Dipteronia dyeriana TaxID=168575 RepID=A0AAD9TJA7_9ROSI|nr:hypothetical protein Ddye_031342 [Dipteronia dyeriana]
MDAYQQQPHRYMRPPLPPQPPPTADYHHHNHYVHQQQQQAPPPPPPQQGPPVPPQGQQQWYPNQFHYQPPPSPPQPSQWAPPPPPPPLPYPSQHQNNHYPLLPRPHVPPHISQSYPQPNQDWNNPNWAHHHQAWDYSAHNNTQDWAARAKEWANARAAMENQQLQSQFNPVGRPEEQAQSSVQYQQAADFHYPDAQQQSLPTPNYQQFPVPPAPPHHPPMAYQQGTTSVSSGPSYVPDVRVPYLGRDGASAGEANVEFTRQESLHSSPSVLPQEVPSSYSSVTGKEETTDQKDYMYRSLPMQISSSQEGQPFAYGNHAADPTTDLSDQPLQFAPRFNHDHDLHMQSTFATHHDSAGTVRNVDPVAAIPSVNPWTSPVAPGLVYPPMPPGLPSGPQHDPSMAMASVPGPAAPQFGRFHGPGFQPTISSAGAFGLGAGASLHPTAAFPGDAYGVSGISERPKKAPVPNWLKEEIIKNKAVMTKSSIEIPYEDTQSTEDEGAHKSFGKGDQADSKSIDSPRSTEEEDDDEDYVEAARTAAINHEIKRILTEVLLKVTDELFDEIATKVLNEDDLTVEVDHNTVASNGKVSSPPPAVPTPKASAKVLVPVKAKESETEGDNEKSSSSSPGDVLGLGNYASDNDDNDDNNRADEIQSASVPSSRDNAVRQSNMNKLSEEIRDAAENGHMELEGHNRVRSNLDSDLNKTSTFASKNNKSSTISKLSENRIEREYKHVNNVDGGKLLDGEKTTVDIKSELHGRNGNVKKSTNDNSQSTETRIRSAKNDRHESKKSHSGKNSGKEIEIGTGTDEMGDENRKRQEERQLRKEKADDWNGSRDKMKEKGVKSEEKTTESKSRKKSTHLDVKEDRKDAERHHRASAKEGIDKKRERSKDEDTSRHKRTSDSSRHKRRRSSSISSRGRNSKENSVSHANDSSDETSNDSKRKSRSRKRNLSPSPVRSRRRQVSRSPHSKNSQRRHSPYSSLETTRGRRSRSSSPVRRHR